jgi:hypothetical protein
LAKVIADTSSKTVPVFAAGIRLEFSVAEIRAEFLSGPSIHSERKTRRAQQR